MELKLKTNQCFKYDDKRWENLFSSLKMTFLECDGEPKAFRTFFANVLLNNVAESYQKLDNPNQYFHN